MPSLHPDQLSHDARLMSNYIVPENQRSEKKVGRFGRPPIDQIYDTRKEVKVPRLAPKIKDK